MISCSWDRFRASYQGVFSPLLIRQGVEMEGQQKTVNKKQKLTEQIVCHLPTGAELRCCCRYCATVQLAATCVAPGTANYPSYSSDQVSW